MNNAVCQLEQLRDNCEDAEVTCPICEADYVEEREHEFVCLCCGESWMYLNMAV